MTLPEGWHMDPHANLADSLPECRAVVTVTSTVAVEALTLGLPVATFGRSVWASCDAMLKCHRNPARVADVLTAEVDQYNALGLLCAIQRHHIPYGAGLHTVLACPSVIAWLESVTGKPGTVVSAVAKQSTTRIRLHGDPARIERLASIERQIKGGCTCARTRHQRSIIDLARGMECDT